MSSWRRSSPTALPPHLRPRPLEEKRGRPADGPSSCDRPRGSADSHRNEDTRVASLDEERDVPLRVLDRALESRSARDRRTVGRGPRGPLDQQSALDVTLTLLIAGQRTHREAELAAFVLRLSVGGGAALLQGSELDAHVSRGVIAPELEIRGGAGAELRDLLRELRRRVDRFAVQLEDDIARLDAGVRRRTALLDARDQGAFRLRQAERVGQILGHVLDHDAELAAGHVA